MKTIDVSRILNGNLLVMNPVSAAVFLRYISATFEYFGGGLA